MTTSPLHVLDEVREHALEALADPDRPALVAVAGLSAHLAAFHHTVEPVLLRHGSTRGDLVGLRSRASGLSRELRVLERVASGEAGASAYDLARQRQHVADLVRDVGRSESALLGRLVLRLDKAQALRLAEDYRRELLRGPTRPHVAGGSRVMGRTARRLNAWRDHVLDVLDARTVELGRPPRAHVVTGRERRGLTDADRDGGDSTRAA